MAPPLPPLCVKLLVHERVKRTHPQHSTNREEADKATPKKSECNKLDKKKTAQRENGQKKNKNRGLNGHWTKEQKLISNKEHGEDKKTCLISLY